MSNEKIAESIIIRVGGGIREVPRKPDKIAEGLETVNQQPGLESMEDVQQLEVDSDTIGVKKVIN